MKRPIIFLDFDGVLNTEQYQAQLATEGKPTKDEWGPLFDPLAVANLKKIIDATKAEIIITSTWRYLHSLDGLIRMWKDRELPGKVRGILPCDTVCLSRGEEIDDWLEGKGHIDYIIIDDLDDFLPEQHNHFVETNPIVGITETDAGKAIEILIYINK